VTSAVVLALPAAAVVVFGIIGPGVFPLPHFVVRGARRYGFFVNGQERSLGRGGGRARRFRVSAHVARDERQCFLVGCVQVMSFGHVQAILAVQKLHNVAGRVADLPEKKKKDRLQVNNYNAGPTTSEIILLVHKSSNLGRPR
jgi:hypothetical protein